MKTIKERALELLRQFPLQYLAPVKLHEVCNELETVLKTLAYAPEPAPVGEAVNFNGWEIVLWKGKESDFPVGTKFYASPPANNQSEQHLEMVNQPELKEGEIYAGIILNSEGAPSRHLILLPGDSDAASWKTQTEWAKSIGGELPTRAEQSLVFANCKQHFQKNWYWSGEQHASEPSWAWYQTFDDGRQNPHHKNNELRARAVRRVEIK
jgi:hypothetical protein